MRIEELINRQASAEKAINALKNGRITKQPNADEARKALDPKRHPIVTDKITRPDKAVITEEGTHFEKVARIALPYQKLIINRAVAFLFGNNPLYNADPVNKQEEAVFDAFKRILADNKSDAFNRRVARSVLGFQEAAELWYPVQSDKHHSRYGFETPFKLRCTILSPERGDTLYPYFDDLGDMVAFSRHYIKEAGSGATATSTHYFETYTEQAHYRWEQRGGAGGRGEWLLSEGFPKPNPLGKIPVVYAYQAQTETAEVNPLIERLETLLSNFADTNDYHAAPKIFIRGDLKQFAKKGESGSIIEGEIGSDAQYLSWNHAPESVRLEIDTITRQILSLTQTPDISFENVRGMGTASGVALKLLFMDAHLKVQDKREIFDEYLQRRANVVKAFIGQFAVTLQEAAENLYITPEITPYIITSDVDDLEYWMRANGGKPVISQKESILKIGISQDPEGTFEQIREEEHAANSFSLGEPINEE